MAHALASPLVQLDSLRVLPVADVPDGTDCAALGDAMVRAGLPLLEVTLRRPGAIDTLAALAADDRLLVGAGTVVNAGQARDAIAAGARFVVSPGIDRDIIQTCLDAAIPVVPGVATPSEIMIALGMGIDVVKYFPAAALCGVAPIRAFSAPFAGVRFVPTGGIDMASAPTYLAEQSVLAIGGSWMVSTTLLRSGNWAEVTALAAEASTLGGPR